MKRKIIFTLFACITSVYLYGQATASKVKPVQRDIENLLLQNEIFYPVTVFSNPESKIEEGIGPYTKMTVDEQKINDVFKANYKSIRLEIPLPGNKSVSVLLTQHKVHTDDFEFTITDATGKHPVNMTEGRYYYGIINNETNTLAVISIFENEISGVISNEKGNWNIGKKKDQANTYVFFNDYEFQLPISLSCGTVDPEQSTAEKGGGGNSTMTLFAGSGNCAKIFFDLSSSLVNSMGSTGATNHVNSIFNVEYTIYYNDQINVAMSSMHLWTVTDPFDINNTNGALTTFQAYYNTNGYTGSIACLIDDNIIGGGGLAYFSSICNSNSYNVANISGTVNNYPTYSWDANVVTHECGHNLGSRHTHWCGWVGGAIDNCNTYWGSSTPGGTISNSCSGGFPYPLGTEGGCANGSSPGSGGGTIMSYCHGCSNIGINFTNGFGSQPRDAIKARIAAAGCINVCTSCNTNHDAYGNFFTGYDYTIWVTDNVNIFSAVYQTGSNAIYNAGVGILLQPNVEILSGAYFLASVGCTPATKLAASAINDNATKIALKQTSLGNDLLVSPNPFAEQIKAAFELTSSALVTVDIIDQAGRAEHHALSNQQMEKGRQEVNINTSKLSPGMYFLVVSINDIKYTKKLVKL